MFGRKIEADDSTYYFQKKLDDSIEDLQEALLLVNIERCEIYTCLNL